MLCINSYQQELLNENSKNQDTNVQYYVKSKSLINETSVTSSLLLLPFLSVALHESSTRNALLGPWPNNTEVYLTSFISTQNHTIAG